MPSIRGRCAKRPNDARSVASFPIVVPARLDLGPQPRLGYIANAIDRVAGSRGDDAVLKKYCEHALAGNYVIGGELIVLRPAGSSYEPLFSPVQARALGAVREVVFLGLLGDAPRFGFGLDPDAVEQLKTRDDLKIADLRSIAVHGMVAEAHLPPLRRKAQRSWPLPDRFAHNLLSVRMRPCRNCSRATSASRRIN